MSKRQLWLCSSCSEELDTSDSIVCESCLEWYHLICVGLTKPPKKKGEQVRCWGPDGSRLVLESHAIEPLSHAIEPLYYMVL